ncbi:MAG TPA: hypothetical protein PKD64_15605 [Pirellulaceae bacterium]|nr:hypothetical protein [Pirellulaceae bacterium]HMO93612.1 hypothetical protein [Pirellulaceae bacterium]HMP70484.1 hypothetical protein [Pirellulaceae bacterium]
MFDALKLRYLNFVTCVRRRRVTYVVCGFLWWVPAIICSAQERFNDAPIRYVDAAVHDRVQLLARKLENGEHQLAWDQKYGWLPSLLNALDIPTDSQTLVFSKTSLQIHAINPRNPRALYFNDDVYLGWVPGGDLIELSAVDPVQGAIFYSLKTEFDSQPRIQRDNSRCLSCHATGNTQNVPGYLVRSVFAGKNGHPHYALGTTTTDHTTAFEDRFGGWYVTGEHGLMRHRGNVFARNDANDPLDRDEGANRPQLPDLVDVSRYLAENSDLVALMVLEHQSQMHNYITRASYETRLAIHYEESMNEIFERPAGTLSESAERRIASACEQLIEYLLFCDEADLQGPLKGSSPFAETFQQQGIRDSKGRSLRDLDMHQRMFKYPCSFLIHSAAFDALPQRALTYIARRLSEILTGTDSSEKFSHLSVADRGAILEHLSETKPQLWAR